MQRTCAIFVLALSALACGGGPTMPSGTAMLNVRLTDSPFTDADAVLVTFSTIRAHRSDSDWTTVPFADGETSRTCDLKKLENGAEDVLGSGPLPIGKYTQVRLVVDHAEIYFDNPSTGPACAPSITAPQGPMANLQIPSGEVKLNRGFELALNVPITMRLDFDGDSSIHLTGSGIYMMSPVIAVLSVTTP